MINRVLIRTKVVQLLYSHLISDTSFSVEQLDAEPTREKRFAHALYTQTLVLMVKVAEGIAKRGGYRPLAETPFIKSVKADEYIASLLRRRSTGSFLLAPMEETVREKVKESALYKNFTKDAEGDRRIWAEIFRQIILADPQFNRLASGMEGYTLHGVERMRDMMERTFARFYAAGSPAEAVRQLKRSLDKARELYFRLLDLPVALTRLRELELDEARHKYVATSEDLNPNLRFVENKLAPAIEADPAFEEFLADHHCGWLPAERDFVARLLKEVMGSQLYRDYMETPGESTLREDADFWRNVLKEVVFRSADFLESLEEKSVFWNDDLDIIGEFVLKTIKRWGEERKGKDGVAKSPVMPMFKDDEDARFGTELLSAALRNETLYRSLVAEAVKTSSWEADRLAYMDVVIIMTALAEMLTFPKIPLAVTVNEYVEIAKGYSTAKSGSFVHGVLRNLANRLKEEGKLAK